MARFLEKFFGDSSKKIIKQFQPIVNEINGLEPSMSQLTDEQLKAKTPEFKAGLEKGASLDDILPGAFAVVREVGKRLMGMRHYDVQLIGGIALHKGMVAEMRTGEGKTLVATLPTYLNALEGKGVHVVTVNDYLAKRDAVWMAQIYDFLGLTVGVVQNQRVSFVYDATAKEKQEGGELDQERDETGSFKVEDDFLRAVSRKEVYECDITYGTNNEFGFDYLRDNMVQSLGDMVMRPGNEMHYCIIDEVDSILIDESRTPLIISAPAEEAAEQYYQFARLVKQLKEDEDYNIDEKMRSATLTDEGIRKFEGWLGVENIYVEGGLRMVHHIEQALKAEVLFKKDKEYVVDNDQIVIIDEFTGRKMPGRRYSEGLHQAIEAKEGAAIQRESRTLATITFQNLFRMYNKLSGMTGTAETEKEELFKIYGLDVLVVPTNKPDARIDNPDRIYKSETAKYKAVVEQIKTCREKGQPILVGTISVEKNEVLSQYLGAQGIPHEALNAKNHEREGEIVAQAGRPGAVTLATNMAGRGVDIKLGGSPVNKEEEQKVLDAGGLFVLGTERHESRRIDNQLRGRAARQGDKGETQFYVSTEDELMRIFAGDRLKGVMERLNVPDDMPIEQKMITRMLENAQKKVESMHYDTRKHLLNYDDVLNRHREVIYEKRRAIIDLEDENLKAEQSSKDMIMEMIESEIEFVVGYHTNPQMVDEVDAKQQTEWNMKEVFETMKTIFPLSQQDRETLFALGKKGSAGKENDVTVREEIVSLLIGRAKEEYARIEEAVKQSHETEDPEKLVHGFERAMMLRAIDALWVEHLVSLDYLRTGIGLRGYGQRDPLVEYKKESFHMFQSLLTNIQKEVVYSFFKVGTGLQLAPTVMAADKLTLKGADKSHSAQGAHIAKKERNEQGEKIGRNDPCPCGSGKKYKKCHGR